MRKPLLVIGFVILLISITFLMGGIYEEYFSIPIKIIHNNQIIYQEKCAMSIWKIGMKERSGSYEKLYIKTIAEGHNSVQALNFLSEGLGDRMERLANSFEKKCVDAKLSVSKLPPYFTYAKHIDGKKVDFDNFAKLVAIALDKGSAQLVTENKKADITLTHLRERTSLRGEFCTSFVTSTAERKSNIKLALSSLNGYRVEPNEEFSFNDAVGPRSAVRGYKSAKIISHGKFVEGIGGGVCQVSTTLYNAVLLSDLEVSYAIRHSLPVAYVPPSRDAMVSSTNDFKFINNTNHPIYIFTESQNNNAKISIYGHVKNFKIELKSVIVRRIPYNNYTVSGNLIDNLEGYKRLTEGKNGLASELYLIKNGKKERIRQDIYAPQHSLWLEEINEINISLLQNRFA